MSPSTASSAHALVERTTVPRGMPFYVEDPVVLSRLAALLAPAAHRELAIGGADGVGARAGHLPLGGLPPSQQVTATSRT